MRTVRKVTLHDIAALHVHSDGTRTTKKNKLKTTIDGLGNVIVASGEANKFRQKKSDLDRIRKQKPSVASSSKLGLSDDVAMDAEKAEDTSATPGAGPSKRKRSGKDELKDLRAKRRREYESDITFLQPSQQDDLQPAPESDFLKTIHYIASKHYEARGVLYQAHRIGKEAEREKHARLRKSKKGELDTKEGSEAASEEPDPSVVNAGQSSSWTVLDIPRKRRTKDPPMKDMYQAFDGGMLIALGILIQEDIAFHLTAHSLPEDWHELDETDASYPSTPGQ